MRYIDLYIHGTGRLFQVPAEALVGLLLLGVKATRAGAALLADEGKDPGALLRQAALGDALREWMKGTEEHNEGL